LEEVTSNRFLVSEYDNSQRFVFLVVSIKVFSRISIVSVHSRNPQFFVKILNNNIHKEKRQTQIGSASKFMTPPDAVIFHGAAHPNERVTGQLKRCTVIREAYLMPPQNSLSKL
jgi:hypothetical protein